MGATKFSTVIVLSIFAYCTTIAAEDLNFIAYSGSDAPHIFTKAVPHIVTPPAAAQYVNCLSSPSKNGRMIADAGSLADSNVRQVRAFTDPEELDNGAQPGAEITTSSPDQIAFANRPTGTDHIYAINADGSNLRQLTNSSISDTGPVAWSKDGKQITFSRSGNIFRMNANGTNQRQLTASRRDFMPDWSPDGTNIVFLHVYNPGPPPITFFHTINSADGSNETELLGNGKSFFAAPHYSPGGKKLLFESTLNTPGTFEIYTCSVSSCSTTVTQLTDLYPGAVADPSWSFDGSKIAVSMANALTGANVNVGIMNADGSNLTQLTHFIEPFEAQDPSISPDGKHIAYELDNCTGVSNCYGGNNNNATAMVYTMNIDGRDQFSTGRACSEIGCSPRYKPVLISTTISGSTAQMKRERSCWVHISGNLLTREIDIDRHF